jgi:hypothetical protein
MAQGDVVTQAALDRLDNQALSQQEASSQQLALTPYEYGRQPAGVNPASGPSAQAQHPSAQRLAAPSWAGKTGTLNHAQAAQDRADVWVTVPVDKVVSSGGSSAVAPVYATPTGYVPRPGESTGSIPPAMAAGHPY